MATVIPLSRRLAAGTTEPATVGVGLDAGDGRLGVSSEVGRLRRVIVHRPGLELHRLTPENKEQLLFDDVVWVDRAQAEHDALVALLRARGVRVLYVHDLLAEVLENAQARDSLVSAALPHGQLGPVLAEAAREWLTTIAAGELAELLIGGIRYGELPFDRRTLLGRLRSTDAFVVAPLVNHMFTRDSSTWIAQTVMTHPMATPVRQRESLHLAAIYRHHPLFAGARHESWDTGASGDAALEGGDVLVIGESTLLVGMGERTHPGAVELYAHRLFEAGLIDRLIAIVLPRSRSSIHLDAVLTMVDVDAFAVYPRVWKSLDAYLLRPSRHGVAAEQVTDLTQAISRSLGRDVRLIAGASDPEIARREQWDEAANLLALAPGTAIAYERNSHANRRLVEHGIEVLTVPGSELSRGRGGPRCLTCPVSRAPL